MPVDKQAGDELFAGTLNTTGALVARTTRPAADSTLSRVASLVEAAQGSRAPAERFIDRFAAIYTPLVFVAALLLATVPLAFGGDSGTWLYRALALLIVACPCSLVISVPVAVVSAVGGAARRGILIKGGQALEDLGRVRARRARQDRHAHPRAPPAPRRRRATDDPEDALALVAAVEARFRASAGRRTAPRRPRSRARRAHGRVPSKPSQGAAPRRSVDGRELWAGGPRLIEERLGALPPELADAARGGPDRDRARRGRSGCSRCSASPTSLAPRRGRAGPRGAKPRESSAWSC